MEFLRENAMEFEKTAREKLEQGSVKMAMFCLEQAFQLYLKYFLAKSIGDFPRTHSLRRLVKEASKISDELLAFSREYSDLLGNVERAYIGARYYPMEFDRGDVERGLKALEIMKRLIL